MSKWFSAMRSATCGFTPWKKRNSLHPENTSHGAQTHRNAKPLGSKGERRQAEAI